MPKKFYTHYLPAIVWAIIIFILSSVPGNEYPSAVFDYSIIAHLIEYFVLAVLISRALGIKTKSQLFLAFFICALYGLSDELHQLAVPYRSSSLEDFLIDMAAIILGIVFYQLMAKLQTR
ncbi:hypothetical protein COX27_00550 [Candidatus Kuenenbacteria bacterium CG23_combo_of_CG06-09_8_20_14_all_36_9]|uniref:VanZ-like domain-containing protein n=1 Tax=Candidatus Kuenenbacteria bacterium CG10_big_fil_rev_8_21_14_0_10_36_11 TaxID=1974618 RepID=A0A2M6WA56_9BACT|nr:MAG: hypothetical protein COX27_00550 [Candidatus Kuenenbacteria bacterium CG23_combo_of_CG06-09_8_20_14_all_36_9]PIT89698.1 MAG: hypothetical protein COU23_02335 [Candidatus Kuenenbacteria bacterium CG10_big_fil_rev_8_21_14_0_10_36_11]